MRDEVFGDLPSAFYENNSNTFTVPSGAGFTNDDAESYSNAIGDVNNDGFPDITVVNRSLRSNFLWINNCETNISNNWLKVSLEGDISNRMGIGSRIEISINGEKQYRYTLCREGYTNQNSGTDFFGIGSATINYVKVTWLSGVVDIINNVSANQIIHVVEGSTLSVMENNFSTIDVKVFPNPNEGNFQINISNFEEYFNIVLYNVLDQKVYNKAKIYSNDYINIKNLSKGVYSLKIVTLQGEVSKKLIIN